MWYLGYVGMKLTKSRTENTDQSGGALVEAAVVLPLFLGIILASLYLLLFCFQMLRFQYDVAESTRETFTKNRQDRGNASWGAYLLAQLSTRSRDLNLPAWTLEDVTFSGCNAGGTPQDTLALCGQMAEPGQSVSLIFAITQNFGLQDIGDLSLPEITFRTKSVAVIQMTEAE